jgi:uncharacterized membrane protein
MRFWRIKPDRFPRPVRFAHLFLLFPFCLAIRTAFLTQKNIWYDEAFSWHLSQFSFFNIYIVTAGDIHPPFYYFVLKIWNAAFGDSLLSMRMMSAVFSTASLYFVYKIARRYLDETSSYLACILYTISPLNIFFAQEVRMASLSLFLTVAATFCFLSIPTKVGIPSSNRESRNYTIAYITLSALALYTHYFTALIILSHFVYFLLTRRKTGTDFPSVREGIKGWAFVVIFAIFIPWLPIMLKQIWTGQPWREGQTLLAAGEQVFDFMNDITLGFYFRFEKNILTTTFQGLTLLLALGFFWKSVSSLRSVPGGRGGTLILLLVLIPLVFAVFIAIFRWIEFFRYLSIILPYILISGFVVFQGLSEKIKVSIFLLFFVSNIYGDWLYFKKDFKNNDYRQVVADIRADSKPGDRIFVYPFYYRWNLEYYQKHGGLPEIFDYGYEYTRLREELSTHKKGDVFFILDYSFPDTTGHAEKLKDLQKDYEIILSKLHKGIPDRIEIYKLKPRF